VHDMLHDLAQQIYEKEEKCFFRVGRNLQEFPDDDCSTHFRISLMGNNLPNVPNTFESSHNHSWLMHNNPDLTKIPQQVIGSMISLRVLDLSRTVVLSVIAKKHTMFEAFSFPQRSELRPLPRRGQVKAAIAVSLLSSVLSLAFGFKSTVKKSLSRRSSSRGSRCSTS
ncbi:hypothetical protein KI387_006853, partial [Taxus chinensis]